MSLNATMLREGMSIVFHCLGKDVQEAHQFLKGSIVRFQHFPHGGGLGGLAGTGHSVEKIVELAGTQTEEGTEWIVHETTDARVFTFECASTGQFLNGETPASKVNLGDKNEIGTLWRLSDLPDPGQIHVTLQCQGGFLNGHTREGSVDLANTTEEPFSGTHWELIVFQSVVPEEGSSGLGGLPQPHV
jgi:hypothetical protein